MIFLGWNRPLLHATVDWLLDPANIPAAPDLSGVIVVVRGGRAGRRLLELLALRCVERGLILVPPEIVTPARLVPRLTLPLPGEPVEATPLASALAWAEAIRAASDADRDTLFRRPGAGSEGTAAAPGVRALLGLGQHLAQIWDELGVAGLAFRDVVRVIGERFPNIAGFEAPRWEVIETLHRRAGRILQERGLIGHTDLLRVRARDGEIVPGRRVVLAGVSEMPRIVRDLLARLPEPPAALVFAPETERAGFEEPGLLRPAYWLDRPAGVGAGEIHLVERDRDQALRAVRLVAAWRESGVAPAQMTLAVPDAKALPRLREALEGGGVKTRWAQGRPVSDAPAFQLLRLVADYLDREPGEPPRYDAVAALARHPDVARLDPGDWAALDRFATDRLPERFDPEGLGGVSDRVLRVAETLRRFVGIEPDETAPREAAEAVHRFLVRVYGTHEQNALSPHGRVAVRALELLRDFLAGTALGCLPWPARVRPADFLHVAIGFLGDEPVPEPPDADAVEITGWLELLDDDAPAAAVLSFHEGAVPETVSADPFLPGSLRQALGLGDNAARLARDAAALAAILASRAENRGALALIAPRFDPADNPVRPSRLLLNGLRDEALARRVWHLAGRRGAEPLPQLREGDGFGAAPVIAMPPVGSLRVTAFRDYLESPRKFYFLHVLGLRAEDDAVLELEASDAGTLIHRALAAFAGDDTRRELTDPAALAAFLDEKLREIATARFGRWAQPAVEIQLDEVRRRLAGFARAQTELRREGWRIRYAEGAEGLACEFPAAESAGTLTLTGRIDRIDCDASGERWRIIDYKTSATARQPFEAHYRIRAGAWADLQLPLYLRLAAPYARDRWGVELTPENCELVYFQLPEDASRAGLSTPFPAGRIPEAWDLAATLAARILRGDFADNPDLDTQRNDPALLALCGQVGLSTAVPDEDAA